MSMEIYTSPVGVPTENDAHEMLEKIRSRFSNWTEIDAYVELHLDGWHAVRVHKKP